VEGGGRGWKEGGRGSNYPPLFPWEIQSNKSSDRWHKDFAIIRTPNIFKEIGKKANSSVEVIYESFLLLCTSRTVFEIENFYLYIGDCFKTKYSQGYGFALI
jgi:hypothetical protein